MAGRLTFSPVPSGVLTQTKWMHFRKNQQREPGGETKCLQGLQVEALAILISICFSVLMTPTKKERAPP
jgi:hypothetical protein